MITVTIDGIPHMLEKLDSGNIRVRRPGAPINPMHGPDTDGEHVFEVHPCQRCQYELYEAHLPADERARGGEGAGGPTPWWSSKRWGTGGRQR